MCREIRVQSQVASYQRLKKRYLIPPCLTLSMIRYVSSVVEQSRERSSALPYTSVEQLLKRKPSGRPRLRSPALLTIAQWPFCIELTYHSWFTSVKVKAASILILSQHSSYSKLGYISFSKQTCGNLCHSLKTRGGSCCLFYTHNE